MKKTRNASLCSSNGVDRISGLPDALIHDIMSFNDTKYAVRTCVLSKRWIHVWKSLPFLNFKSWPYPRKDPDHRRFTYFVDMVLILRDDDYDIQIFALDWSTLDYDNDTVTKNVNRWIVDAVNHKVQEITIRMCKDCPSAYEIPYQLLNCKSLTKLKMHLLCGGGCADVVLPSSMNLPQLKVLSLIRLSISGVELSTRFFSSCPVLETLEIIHCIIQTDYQRNLIVDSPSLKKLSYFSYNFQQNDTTMANVIKFCAPNLEDFTCWSLLTQDYSLEYCPSISRVNFRMMLQLGAEEVEMYEELPSTEKTVYGTLVMKFLGAVYMVKDLNLSSGFLEFKNLADVGDDWEARLSSPGMLSHLKYVQITGAVGCDSQFKILSFLLKNAKVLEQVDVYINCMVHHPDFMRQMEIFEKKLKAVPRASSNVELLFKNLVRDMRSVRFTGTCNKK